MSINQQNISQLNSILGVSTQQLAGLSVDEITGNKEAITMVMHYYKQLVEENNMLKNEMNTLKSYVPAYQISKSNSNTGGILLLISNIPIAFGINLLTSKSIFPGLATLLPGILILGVGIYFNFIKEKN